MSYLEYDEQKKFIKWHKSVSGSLWCKHRGCHLIVFPFRNGWGFAIWGKASHADGIYSKADAKRFGWVRLNKLCDEIDEMIRARGSSVLGVIKQIGEKECIPTT